MSSPTPAFRGPGSFRVVAVVGALAAFAVVWAATSRYGPGMTPDSVGYVSTAENLADHLAFAVYNGSPYVDWPPLFPLLLAALDAFFGIEPIAGARLVNATAFAVLVALTPLLVKGFGPRLVLLGVVALSVPFVRVSVMAWSEPLFLVLTLAFLVCLTEELEESRPLALWGAAVAAGLACVTRYTGVTLVATGVFALLFLSRRRPFSARVEGAALFGLIASWPLTVWIVRNVVVTGTPFGIRSSSGYGLVEPTLRLLDTIAGWLLPMLPARPAVGVLVGATVVLGVLGTTFPLARAEWRRLVPLVSFVAIYGSFVVASAASTPLDPLDARLLSPLYLPLAAFVVTVMAPLASRVANPPRLARLAFVAWALVPATTIALETRQRIEYGAGGYHTQAWQRSETVRWLRRTPEARLQLVYSNAPEACWLFARVPAFFAPRTERPARRWPPEPALLVWFDEVDRSYVTKPSRLARAARLDRVTRLDDGSVFAVEPRRRFVPMELSSAGRDGRFASIDGASDGSTPDRSPARHTH